MTILQRNPLAGPHTQAGKADKIRRGIACFQPDGITVFLKTPANLLYRIAAPAELSPSGRTKTLSLLRTAITSLFALPAFGGISCSDSQYADSLSFAIPPSEPRVGISPVF
jgi:hypothetical protein